MNGYTSDELLAQLLTVAEPQQIFINIDPPAEGARHPRVMVNVIRPRIIIPDGWLEFPGPSLAGTLADAVAWIIHNPKPIQRPSEDSGDL